MINFHYVRATDVADAVRLIAADPMAKFIAGGTNLIDLMKEDVERPTRLIDITRLPLNSVEETADCALAHSWDCALAHSCRIPTSPITQWSRSAIPCWRVRSWPVPRRNCVIWSRPVAIFCNARAAIIFYDIATPCNKREPGGGCSAIADLNRIHAILGTSEACIASHPSDMCVALTALDATVHVAGPSGARAIAFADFHRLPGNTPQRDTNLESNEIVTAVELPPRGFPANYTYLKIRDRLSYAFALVSVAAALELDGNTITEARLALGGVAHKPWRDPSAEAALRGQIADKAVFTRAADHLLRDVKGFAHNAFKIDLARRTIVRALTQAASDTPQSQSNKKIW